MTIDTRELPPFASLIEVHGDELLAYSRRLTNDGAEDVLQDALLKALKAYPRLRDGSHIRAWLFRVTTTCAIDHMNRIRAVGRLRLVMQTATCPHLRATCLHSTVSLPTCRSRRKPPSYFVT